jgi:Rieske 2Fe-2S family protein
MTERPTLHPASPLLDRCPPSLPATDYHDPTVFAAEREAIWAREWVYAGRAADLPAMTLRRMDVAGRNIFLVKDQDGRIRAFHNTCRHRGSELCPADERKLKSRLIICPYHAWAYDISGNLIRTPFVLETADFRREDHGLFPVPVTEWKGCLFVCVAEEAPDFAAAPDLPHALDNWPLAGLVTGHVWEKELACNWKVFWENYNECLHCPGIHPELTAMVPVYKQGIMAPNEAASWTPETPVDPHGLRPGARTWTMDGRPCGSEFPGLTEAERAGGFTFVTVLPSTFVVAHVDYARIVSLTPLAPERTRLRAEWLFPQETLAAPGFDLTNVVDFAKTVLSQDGAACEMNQRGLRNPRFAQGTLMPQEFDVHRFQEWVRARRAPASELSGGRP